LETLEMRRKVAETTGAAAELARRQREAGNLSRLREAQHRALHEEAILELARAEADVVAQREALNRLMGVWGESTHWRVVNERLTRLPGEEPSLMDLESLAVGQRLDLAAARAEVDAVTRALELTRRWRFLGGLSFGYNSEREADGQYLLGPNLEIDLPLFDRKQARIQALEAQRRRADQRLRSLAIDIRSEVREARAGLLVARETARYYETAVLPTRETIVEQMQLFQSGMLESTYELLQVKREQIDSMQAAIEAREAYWQARVTLEKALGGRLDDAWPAPAPAGGASAARIDDKPQMDGAGHGAHGGK
jgi:cobalt-zinc-cadmium efflux system outer membrane protein